MAEYANREAGYAGNMQEQIKAFVDVIIDGHEHTEDRAFQRVLNIMQNAENEEITQEMSILGIPENLKFHASLPAILFMRLGGYGFDDDTYIEGHMDVGAMTSSTTKARSETGVDAEAKVGWGPFSASVKIHSHVAVENERKRESDYSAGVKWRVGFKRLPPPEGVMKIVDTLISIQETGNEINKMIAARIAASLEAAANETAESEGG